MSKRFLWLIAMLSVFSLIAAACGDDDDDDGTETGTETAEETTGGEDTAMEDTEGDAAAGGEGSIWVLLPDSATSDRWEKDDRRFFGEAFEAAGLADGTDFNIVNAEGSGETQISQAEQAIGEGASVIVLTSNDSGSGATIIDLAKDAGVSVVEYDRFNTEGSAGGDVYVSFDNVKVGATMAEVLSPVIDELDADPKRVVMLNGGETDNNAFLFRDGYDDHGRGEGCGRRVGAGRRPVRSRMGQPRGAGPHGAESWLRPRTTSTLSSPPTTGSAVQSSLPWRTPGLDPTAIPVSGQDATQAGIQNMLLGTQTMSVYKPILAEATVAADAALALRAGEDVTALTGDFVVIGINADGHSRRGSRRRRCRAVHRAHARSVSPPTTWPTRSSPTVSGPSRSSAPATSPRRTSAKRTPDPYGSRSA